MKRAKGYGMGIVFFAIICICVVYGFNQSAQSNEQEDVKRVNTALRNALIECYSVEGFYPEDIDYLKTHYALRVSEDKYRINYDYQGANMTPNIVVYRKGNSYEAKE